MHQEVEQKTCQNCRGLFEVSSGDREFYERLCVPEPTFCPRCRLTRRLAVRNERTLYKAECAACKKIMLSMYPRDTPYAVYCASCYWSDTWDATDYGAVYDFSKPFFTQFRELQLRVPREGLWQIQCADSPYANYLRETRNAYLSYSCVYAESIFYSKNIDASTDIYDSLDVSNSEDCYWIVKGDKNARSLYLFFSSNCLDSMFLYDCGSCSHCFLCTNLRGAKYCFMNEQLSQEEYAEKTREFMTGSYADIQRAYEMLWGLVSGSAHKYARIINSTHSTGDDLLGCRNARACFSAYNLEDVTYAFRCFDVKDSMDLCNIYQNELMYEAVSGGTKQSSRVFFTMHGYSNLRNVEYTDSCHASSSLFGCVGVRNKQYCVFNREYEPAEYERIVECIKRQMCDMPYKDRRGCAYAYGEFFPIELSPFAYNETYAQEYFPLTRDKAEKLGCVWKDQRASDYAVTLRACDLPDALRETSDSLLRDVILCGHSSVNSEVSKCGEQCIGVFRVVPTELSFYRRFNIPIPRLCPNCRHYERLKRRNLMRLWRRKCDRASCMNEFETPYSPESHLVVYCEQCYQKEVI